MMHSSPQVLGVLRTAQAHCHDDENGGPVLINALIGGSDFREGSISV